MPLNSCVDFMALFRGVAEARLTSSGFRWGDRGTHTSRTIMLDELDALLSRMGAGGERRDYAFVVTEENCLGKQTAATRKLSLQRLRELYALDPEIPMFRALRDLWPIDTASHPLLAILAALARDPLLRATASTVLGTATGDEVSRRRFTEDMSRQVGGRFNDSTLDKIIRNASSSWTQSGHLEGRVRKIRCQVQATPVACAYALLLAYLAGRRGRLLFESPFASVLDTPPDDLLLVAAEAKRLGLLNLKQSGTTIDVTFPDLLGHYPRTAAYGTT